ncbi:MAG: HD domain-containing protein, partial [Candidatus Woesearchaeota archaeon]
MNFSNTFNYLWIIAFMEKDIDLLYELGTMRFIKRAWCHFLTPEFANLAEHSFRVAWIAMLIAKKERADTGKVAKIALVHDLSESRSCDAHYLAKLFVKRDEAGAISRSLEGTSLEDLKQLWLEFENRTSMEGRIVRDADTLDIDLELQEQAVKGNKLKEIWKRDRRVTYEKLHTETAKKMWLLMQETNPHAWHTKENIFSEKYLK